MNDPHAGQPILAAGTPLGEARAAMILIHGRGAGAEDILGLAEPLGVDGVAYLAPEAAGRSWYPQSFLVPLEQNEPWLTSALATIGRMFSLTAEAGIPPERVAVGGFSQGACLALEYAARNPQRYGAVVALSGGLTGPEIERGRYRSGLGGSPVFVGCSDIDFYIPVERVHTSAAVMRELGGEVVERIYPGMGHIVNRDEIDHVAALLHQIAAERPVEAGRQRH